MEPATKQDVNEVKEELAGLKQDMVQLRTQTKQDMLQLEGRVAQGFADLEDRMLGQMRHIETTLLTEFRKWAVPTASRAKVTEVRVAGLAERLDLVEERLDAIEGGRA